MCIVLVLLFSCCSQPSHVFESVCVCVWNVLQEVFSEFVTVLLVGSVFSMYIVYKPAVLQLYSHYS